MKKLSIISPVYEEEEVIEKFYYSSSGKIIKAKTKALVS